MHLAEYSVLSGGWLTLWATPSRILAPAFQEIGKFAADIGPIVTSAL